MESSRWRHRGPFLCHGVRFHCHDNRPSTLSNGRSSYFVGSRIPGMQWGNNSYGIDFSTPIPTFLLQGGGVCKGLPGRGLPRVVSEPSMSMKRGIAYGMPAFPIVGAVDSRLRWNDGGGRRLCARGYFHGNDGNYPKVPSSGNPAPRGFWTKISTRGFPPLRELREVEPSANVPLILVRVGGPRWPWVIPA